MHKVLTVIHVSCFQIVHDLFAKRKISECECTERVYCHGVQRVQQETSTVNSDNGGEYMAQHMQTYSKEQGISHKLTAACTPQNKIVKQS